MYLKDKSKTITVRLDETMYDYLQTCAELLESTPSAYVRLMIKSCMANTDLDAVRKAVTLTKHEHS